MCDFEVVLLKGQHQFVFSQDRFPAIIGGLGSGKTQGGIERILYLLTTDPGIDCAYYLPTYDLINLRAIPGFETELSNRGISFKTNKSEYTIAVENFGKIIFRSYEKPKRIVAYEVAHSVVDELDTLKFEDAKFVWRKVSERNRQPSKIPNSIGCVTTPDMGYNGFIYHNWFKLQREGYTVIKASTYDNPFLPEGYIQNILDNYDPILADLYLRGEIVSLNQNKVYHFFDRKKHHDDRELTKHDKFIHATIDFNVGGCCSNIYVIDGNKPIAVDEFVSRDTYDFVNNLAKYKDHIIEVYPDASGTATSTNASRTDIQIITDAGFKVNAPRANPAIRDRVNSFNALLAHNRYGVNTNKCPNLTNALETQGYEKNGNPEKWDTHPAVDDWNDGSGYFINRRWGITKPRVGTSDFAMR